MGRPSKYKEKLALEILMRYASGEFLVNILKPGTMPSRWSLYRWRIAHKDFDEEYEKASLCHADSLVETAFSGVMSGDNKSAKLLDVQFKSSSWLASKIHRLKYGDKIDIDVKNTFDVSPVIAKALERLSALVLPEPVKTIEADAKVV